MRFLKVITCCLLFSSLPYLLGAQTKDSQQGPQSLRDFVQGFYSWYVPHALSDSAGSAWEFAIKEKSSAFSPQLVQALRRDSAAQAKTTSEIVGLDFDPFLAAQDPCENYEVGRITQRVESYLVDIYGVCSGKKHEKPDVIAELQHKNGHWLFVNFHYPQDRNLLAVLKSLQENRRKASD